MIDRKPDLVPHVPEGTTQAFAATTLVLKERLLSPCFGLFRCATPVLY